MSVAAVRKPSLVAAASVKPAPAPVAKTRGRAPLYPLGPAIRLRTEQLAGAEMQGGGKRVFHTSDGQTIELPSDITEEQAAQLEVDAKAAQQRLGKGPAPKPVPDVKKLAKKEVKHEKPKPGSKAGRRGTVRAARKAVRALTALLKGLSSSKVAQYLATKGAPALNKGVGMLQRLAQNEQTHDNAGAKLSQSELAVVHPPSEGQSKSNTGQVGMVADRPAPVADENKAKQKLQESLQANTPKKIEDVDNFKRDMKAQHMGADVLQVVQGDKNAVTSTFGTIGKTPDPFPPEHTPETLPPQEIAPPTPALNLGQGAIAPLQPEHTDVSNFTKDADSKLKDEGITQEQLDMVDSGDLAAAKKEKKGLENSARTEPLAVQAFARKQTQIVDQDLKQEEKKGRDGLRAKHKADLGATTRKQKGTQSALEKKREEVASKINGIYKAAQDSVKKKLDDLETQSMKRFDDGNAKATKDFEDNVNREIDAFKDDRYSGWFGWARKAKDWLLGMDDLPEVKAIFDRNRAAFVNTIDKLVADISADNKRVIQECKDELANARKAIKVYVDHLAPNLKEIGQKAAGEMNARLNDLDQFINRKQEELQNKLKDKQTAAIKAIDEKIEKMKEAMAGALAKLGKLLLLAAKKFFTWALEQFGYSLEEIEGIINRGAAVLKAIFTKPIQFVKNLISAASLGFKNFAKNFLTHLKDAIFDWLTGSLEGVQLPDTWDLPGIASVALQMIGLTWANIRGKLVKATNETTVKALETGFELVVTLVKDGPMAAWEKIVEMADDIKAAFIEGVKDFIKIKIIQKAIETIISLFVPGAGVVRAIVGIYDTVVFFIQKAKQIAQMVGNFLSSIGEIAAGNIGAAANALEKGLAMALKLVINFLAKFLRLDGVTAKIRAAIGRLRDKVNSILDKIVEWIVAKAKKLGKFIAQAGTPKDPRERLQTGLKAAAAAVRRLPGNRVAGAVISPVLKAIQLRYGFSSLEPQLKGGRWWIRGTINPSDEVETDKAAGSSTTVPTPSSKYTIRRLLKDENGPGELAEGDAKALRTSLSGLCTMLMSPDLKVQKKGVKQTRDSSGSAFVTDPARRWVSHHGVLYAPFVEDQAAAIETLADDFGDSEAIFGLERGGSLVAEQIARKSKKGIKATDIPKPTDIGGDPIEQRRIQVEHLISRIRAMMAGRENAAVTISVAAAWISGTEANTIINRLNKLLDSGDFPNLQIKLLALRQTLGEDHKSRKGRVLTVEGKVQLVRFQIPYIIAEDVDYQIVREGDASKQPIIVFKGTFAEMVAYQITPTAEGTAREIIVDLATGALKGKLPGVL